jgi:hypothetical protein
MRAGRPMVGKLWQLCSGSCALKPHTSNNLRYQWDWRAAEIAAGRDPFPPKQDRGLGDLIEAAFKATGIKAVIEAWLGKSCQACAARREKLNKLGRWAKRILARKK